MQIAPFHAPEEMQAMSNLAHGIEGTVIGIAAVLALIQASGRLRTARELLLWPGLITVAGIGLLLYLMIPWHGLDRASDQWRFIFGDPQQRQHVIFAALITSGGMLETLQRTGRLTARAWMLAWPLSVAIIGIMFVTHPQHGTDEAVLRATLAELPLRTAKLVAGNCELVAATCEPKRSSHGTAQPNPSGLVTRSFKLAATSLAVLSGSSQLVARSFKLAATSLAILCGSSKLQAGSYQLGYSMW